MPGRLGTAAHCKSAVIKDVTNENCSVGSPTTHSACVYEECDEGGLDCPQISSF